MKFCEHPLPGIALVVLEFHTNLRSRVGSTVYVWGKWVSFNTVAINRFYNPIDNDNEAYTTLFQNKDYQQLVRPLTRG